MKRSKKILLFSLVLLFLCFAVLACKDIAEQSANQSASPDEVTSLRLQLDYYKSRTEDLETELTAAKVQLYLQRSAYEKRLQELKESIPTDAKANAPEPVSNPKPPETVWFHEEKDDGVVITGVSDGGETLEIPAALNGKAVIAVGESAFANSSFSSVVLPDGLREIGWFAFSGCTNLTSVFIPASVERIGYGAFENCSKNLQFVCAENSYAAAFARSYGYALKTD
ncbi:MAG: leucine-rich repeat domain-containing protein [Clostridia bacterium]|nr:leucine-rich repeat domain-containing protein [Clostridia bacterium]